MDTVCNDKRTVDVVIPVFHPGKEFETLLQMLEKQTHPIRKIILMETLCEGEKISDFSNFEKVSVYPVKAEEFDHGYTRNQGIEKSDAEFVLLLTQDAVPKNESFAERMLKAFTDEKVVSAFARQVAKENANPIERCTREFNYPEESFINSKADLKHKGIKTYFCSDVAAMYRRKVWEELGKFSYPAIFNEDMIYAYQVIQNGYRISYVSDAVVYHSHNLKLKDQFRRNFDMGVSQKDHPEIFESVSSEKEGFRYVKKTLAALKREKALHYGFYFFAQCASKYFGYFMGKRYQKRSALKNQKYSSNKNYWRKKEWEKSK